MGITIDILINQVCASLQRLAMPHSVPQRAVHSVCIVSLGFSSFAWLQNGLMLEFRLSLPGFLYRIHAQSSSPIGGREKLVQRSSQDWVVEAKTREVRCCSPCGFRESKSRQLPHNICWLLRKLRRQPQPPAVIRSSTPAFDRVIHTHTGGAANSLAPSQRWPQTFLTAMVLLVLPAVCDVGPSSPDFFKFENHHLGYSCIHELNMLKYVNE